MPIMIHPNTTTAATTTNATTTNDSISTSTLPKTMKSAVLHQIGDATTPEVLSVQEDLPLPVPRQDQLLVKVHAASINPIDWKRMTGDLPGGKPGQRVGSDVAGVVVAIGPNTTSTQLQVGDEIYADAIGTKGSFGEYMIVNANVAYQKPTNLSMAQAASLPLAGLTALQGLINHGKLLGEEEITSDKADKAASTKNKKRILVLGGSGGVGSLAIQMIKGLDSTAEVYATGSNVELIQKLGADVVINYREQSVMDALQDKEGYFDIVYDTIGGYEHWKIGKHVLKKKNQGSEQGIFLTINLEGSLIATIFKALYRTIMGSKLLGGLFGGHPQYKLFFVDTQYDGVQKDMKIMTDLVQAGHVQPLVDERRFDLTTQGLHDIIKASQSHRTKGKLILQVVKK